MAECPMPLFVAQLLNFLAQIFLTGHRTVATGDKFFGHLRRHPTTYG